MKKSREILNEIERRIIKLRKDRKYTINISNPRRIHPAWKQANGRILELKRLKDFIRTT